MLWVKVTYYFLLLLLLAPTSFFGSYLLYPKLESGNNLSEVYQSAFFLPKYEMFSINPYLLAIPSPQVDYGFLTSFSLKSYGILSLSYVEKEATHSYPVATINYNIMYYESAYSITYQKRVRSLNLFIGGNLSDPIHTNPFEYNGQVLPSFHSAVQLEPSQYISIEGGVMNVFKESSQLVDDLSEKFYTATSFMLLEELAIKVSFHKMKGDRINSNILSRYYFTKDFFMGVNISSQPSVMSLASGFSFSHGFIKLFAGLNEKDNGFLFFSFTLPYNPELKRSKQSAKKPSDTLNQENMKRFDHPPDVDNDDQKQLELIKQKFKENE